jgi:hypothetical protein
VACVDCHIGPGAGWYVKSKLSGLYQIYSTAVNAYSRPIDTPIKNLRPAAETCEQCHWPEQFFGAVEQDHQYYLSDEANTPWSTRMLLFVGGGTPPYGKAGGIHWHMNIKNQVYYVATDEDRQVLPWVKVVRPNGEEEVFAAEGAGFSEKKLPEGEMRRMDCVDCHNRPSHIYRAPDVAVNGAMAAGLIDATLPFIKQQAVQVLLGDYASHDAAADKIPAAIRSYYSEKYPEVYSQKREAVERAAQEIVGIYKNNFFPQMKVSWKVYPNNIGHRQFPGCFRCHDGSHISSRGNSISNECQDCHSIIYQGNKESSESAVEGLEFKHPSDIGDAWQSMLCSDCHGAS